jgi:hypothetical protein
MISLATDSFNHAVPARRDTLPRCQKIQPCRCTHGKTIQWAALVENKLQNR